MIKIGAVNIDTSHPEAFAQTYGKGQRARYTAVYNDGFRTDEEVQAFMDANGVENRYDNIDTMAQNVDIGFIHSCNWDNHIKQAMPFIKAGKPVFIDKPIVGNLKDCLELEKLASDGALVLGTSAARYCQEIQAFADILDEERGEIISMTGLCGVDDFGYGIHAIEGMAGIAGPGITSVQFIKRISMNNIASDQYLIKRSDNANLVLHLITGVWLPMAFSITTTKSVHAIQPDLMKIYHPMLEAISDCLETGKKMAPVADMTENVKAHLAAKKSRETEGKQVLLSDLDIDDPGFDGNQYEAEYIKTVRGVK